MITRQFSQVEFAAWAKVLVEVFEGRTLSVLLKKFLHTLIVFEFKLLFVDGIEGSDGSFRLNRLFLKIPEWNFVAIFEYVHKAAPIFFRNLAFDVVLSYLESLFSTVQYEIGYFRSDLDIEDPCFKLVSSPRFSVHFLILKDLLLPSWLPSISLSDSRLLQLYGFFLPMLIPPTRLSRPVPCDHLLALRLMQAHICVFLLKFLLFQKSF